MPRSPHPPSVLRALAAAGGILLAACYGDGPFSASRIGRVHMDIAVQPAAARVGSILGVQPVIEVRNPVGQLIDQAIPITVSLSDGDGHVLGNRTITTQGGIA